MHGRTGALNPRFVDGSSPERQRLYAQGEGRSFIAAALARDGYRCRRCDAPKAGCRSLHVHHIKPWAGNEALRFDSKNVVTLCRTCHSWVHSRANVEREFLA
jgi:thymidylate synthase (FAD)